jgi:hypothetical protein
MRRLLNNLRRAPKKFHSATLPPISDTWRLLKISGEKTFLNSYTNQTGAPNWGKWRERKQPSTPIQGPNNEAKSRVAAANPDPTFESKSAHIHNSSGNDKRRRERTGLCVQPLIPKFRHTKQGNDQRVPLLELLPPPIKSKAAMAVPRGSRSGGASPFSSRKWKTDKTARANGGPIWSDPRRIYLAALAGRVRTETRHACARDPPTG